jgi:hypothetical protein
VRRSRLIGLGRLPRHRPGGHLRDLRELGKVRDIREVPHFGDLRDLREIPRLGDLRDLRNLR